MMDDMRETVDAALGGLERLAAKIPGYAGYKQKEMRREADKLLRTELAQKFDDQRKRLSELQVRLVSQGQIEFIDDLDRAVTKLQLLIDRINTAAYGYAGLFDAVKVKEDQLDALYAFDNEMLDYVDQVAAGVDDVASAIAMEEGTLEATNDLIETISEANTTYEHRKEAILRAASFEDL